MALRELFASFDIDTARAATALHGLNDKVDAAKSKIGGLLEAFIGSEMVHGLGEFVKGQIELGSRVNDLSEKLGVSSDALQAFQFAAGLSGVEAESAAQALGFLNKNMGMALDGNKEAVDTFQKLGIALKDAQGARELADVIPEIADSFEKLESNQERTAVAMKIFGKSGAALIPLLKNGSGELKDLYAQFQKLGGGMDKDFVQAADKAGDELDKMRFGFRNLKQRIAFEFFPLVTSFATKMQGVAITLQKFTRETNFAKYAAVALGLGASAAALKAAAGFAKMLGILPTGAGFWKTVLGLGVWGLVALAVLAVFLVAEDLVTLFTGGQSAIGDFVDSLFGVGTAAEGVILFDGVMAHLRAALEEGKPIWDALVQSVNDLAGAFGITLPGGVEFLRWLRDEFVAGVHFGIDALELLISALSRVATTFSKTLGALKTGDVTGLMNIGENLARAVADAPVPGTPIAPTVHTQGGAPNGGAGAATVTQVNNVTNNISGVKDPAAVGNAAKNGTKDALGGELQNALGATNTGG